MPPRALIPLENIDLDATVADIESIRRANPQRFENIGAAALAGDASVSVFGHGHTAAGHNKSGGGGNVEGLSRIPAGAAGVDHRGLPGLNPPGLSAHGTGCAGKLFERLAFGGQRRHEGADLGV